MDDHLQQIEQSQDESENENLKIIQEDNLRVGDEKMDDESEQNETEFKSLENSDQLEQSFPVTQPDIEINQNLNESQEESDLEKYLQANQHTQENVQDEEQNDEMQFLQHQIQEEKANQLYEELERNTIQIILDQQVSKIEEQFKHKMEIEAQEDALSGSLVSLLLSQMIDFHLIAEDIQNQLLESQMQKMLLDITIDNISEESKRLQVIKLVASDFLERQIQQEIKECANQANQYENSLSLNILDLQEQFLTQVVKNEIRSIYEDEILAQELSENLIRNQIEAIAEQLLQTVTLEFQKFQQELKRRQIEKSVEDLVDVECRQLCREVAEESLILYKSVYFYVQLEQRIIDTQIEQSLDQQIIIDDIFENLLQGLLVKEIAFQVDLERDSRGIIELLFDQSITEITAKDVRSITTNEIVTQDCSQTMIHCLILGESYSIASETLGLNEIAEEMLGKMFQLLLVETLYDQEKQKQDQQLAIRFEQRQREQEFYGIAMREYSSHFLDRYLKKYLRVIADDLILKLITESIYKKIMSKILKRMVYGVIQSSVESYQTLEDNTLYLAERVLDGYVKKNLDVIISGEIVLTNDSLKAQDDFLSIYLRQELRLLLQGCIKAENYLHDPRTAPLPQAARIEQSRRLDSGDHDDAPLYSTMNAAPTFERQFHSPLETRRVEEVFEEIKSLKKGSQKQLAEKANCFKRASLTSKPEFMRKQFVEGYSEEKPSGVKQEFGVRGSELIRIDDLSHLDSHHNPFVSDKSRIEKREGESSSSMSSSDGDMFSDQDEGKVSTKQDGLGEDSIHQSFMSPSKRPDFHRNILSGQKSVSSSMHFKSHQLSSRQQLPRISEKGSVAKQQRNFHALRDNNPHLGYMKSYDESHHHQLRNPDQIILKAKPYENSKQSATQRSYHSRSGSSDLEIKALHFSKAKNYFQAPPGLQTHSSLKNSLHIQSHGSLRGSLQGGDNVEITSAFDQTQQFLPSQLNSQPRNLQNQMAQLHKENYQPSSCLRDFQEDYSQPQLSNRLLNFNNTQTNQALKTHGNDLRYNNQSNLSGGNLSVNSFAGIGNKTQKLGAISNQGSAKNLLQNLRGGRVIYNGGQGGSSAGNLSLTQTCNQVMMKPHMGSMVRNGTAKVLSQLQPTSSLNKFKQRYGQDDAEEEDKFYQRDEDEKTPNDGVGSSFLNDRSDENLYAAETAYLDVQQREAQFFRRNTDSTDSPTARFPPQINKVTQPVMMLDNFSVTSSTASLHQQHEAAQRSLQKQQRLMSNKSQGCLQQRSIDQRQNNQDRYKFEVTAKNHLDQNSTSQQRYNDAAHTSNDSFYSAHSNFHKASNHGQAQVQPPIIIQPHLASGSTTQQLNEDQIKTAKQLHQQRLFQKSKEYQAKRGQQIQKSQQKRSSQLLGSPSSSLINAATEKQHQQRHKLHSEYELQQRPEKSDKHNKLQSYIIQSSVKTTNNDKDAQINKQHSQSIPSSVGGRLFKSSANMKSKVAAGYVKQQHKEMHEDSDQGESESEGDSYNYIFRDDTNKATILNNKTNINNKQLNATGEFDTKVQDFESTTGDYLHFQDTQYMEKSPVSNLSQMQAHSNKAASVSNKSVSSSIQTQLKQKLDAQIQQARRKVEKSYYLSSVERNNKHSTKTTVQSQEGQNTGVSNTTSNNANNFTTAVNKNQTTRDTNEVKANNSKKHTYNLPLQMDMRKDRSSSNLGFTVMNQQMQSQFCKQQVSQPVGTSTKRVGDVMAQQPKEGFKFIEQKVQQSHHLQSVQVSSSSAQSDSMQQLPKNFQHSSAQSQQLNVKSSHHNSLLQNSHQHQVSTYSSQIQPSQNNSTVTASIDRGTPSRAGDASNKSKQVKTICVELQSSSNEDGSSTQNYNTRDSIFHYNPVGNLPNKTSEFETFAKTLTTNHNNYQQEVKSPNIIQGGSRYLAKKTNRRESVGSSTSFEYLNETSNKYLHDQYSSLGSTNGVASSSQATLAQMQQRGGGNGVLAAYNTRLSIGGAIHKQGSMKQEEKQSDKGSVSVASSQVIMGSEGNTTSANTQQFKSVFAKAREMTKKEQGTGEGSCNTTLQGDIKVPAAHISDKLIQANEMQERKRDSDLLQEQSINLQVEKLIMTLKTKQQEIKRSNSKSTQLQNLDQLVKIAQRIVECSKDVEALFEIDQSLKDCLTQLSSGQKHQQESFSVVILTNQLALLNYQKLGCLVEKNQKARNSHLQTQVETSTPKGLTPGIAFKTRSDKQQPQPKVSAQQPTSKQQIISKHPEARSAERKNGLGVYKQQASDVQSTSSIISSHAYALREQKLNKLNSVERNTSHHQLSVEKKRSTHQKQQLQNVPNRHILSEKQVDQHSYLEGEGSSSKTSKHGKVSAKEHSHSSQSVSGFSLGNVMANRIRSGTAYGIEKTQAAKESNNSSVGRVSSAMIKQSSNNMNAKMTSNYFSNGTLTGQKLSMQTLNLKNLHPKDHQFISKYIGKIDGQLHMPVSALMQTSLPQTQEPSTSLLAQQIAQSKLPQQSNQQAPLSTLDYQKRQFYLMALNQFGAKLKQQGISTANNQVSIDDMFTRARSEKVQPKDWREYITSQFKALE